MAAIEQRVMSSPKIGAKIGGGGGSSKPEPEPEPPAKKSKKKLIIIVAAVVVVLAAAAAWYLLMGPGKASGAEGAAPAPEPTAEAGAVLPVEPISINLADGHYLRIGLGLQLTADVGEETPDPSVALDLAISLFSGRTVAEVSDPAQRDALKTELAHQLSEAYEGEVMDVYLTNYVTQ
ncbi:flagellar basal body-associated FliL family protein [Cellulomonas soli]|uniref:flagellar basal body-associated FliL family protein n=1 Tax=Cellulomonas soli TaxID=931535 RepID=UPI003F82E1C4